MEVLIVPFFPLYQMKSEATMEPRNYLLEYELLKSARAALYHRAATLIEDDNVEERILSALQSLSEKMDGIGRELFESARMAGHDIVVFR